MRINIEELVVKFASCHENVKPLKLAGIPRLRGALGGAVQWRWQDLHRPRAVNGT